ncbi:23S rRNA (cytidine-2'-O)-methyltransferase TlyA [Hydrogenimonas sp.]
MRLDAYLVEKGFVESRTKAQELIKEGSVAVDGEVAQKASRKVVDTSKVEVFGESRYVGRAARKLKGFFDTHPVAVAGKRCLDVGASTGGFTQILLEKGAASVVALDVGSGQLHERLRRDPRVTSVESTDIRLYEAEEPFDIVTCDVSFISLHHILEALDRLADGVIVLLFKPQFEVGREARRDRRGVVLDEEAIRTVQRRFEEACEKVGWRLMVKEVSVLPGREGNHEWFYCYVNR